MATSNLLLFPKSVHVLLDTLNLLSINLKESVVHNCEGCLFERTNLKEIKYNVSNAAFQVPVTARIKVNKFHNYDGFVIFLA